MAYGFFRKYAPDDYKPLSAGPFPKSQINPLAAGITMEIGIYNSNQKPKELSEEMIRNADKIVNMGYMDKNFYPALFVSKVLDWGMEYTKENQ